MDETRGKRAMIILSSSSSEEELDDHDDFENSISDDEDDEEEEEEEGDGDDGGLDDLESDDNDDDESLSNKVIALLQEGNDLESLKLKECKAYLRKHGLRLAGNRAVCIKRIREHRRLKDGGGYNLYPRSSFIIDCTGDVCEGDVVLFRQRVYEKFDKVTWHGKLLGKRTVAGRVVKESYGAAKQQHTFTVEVIWSSGVKKLPPLFPLLVKGRNLYKLKTYRQRWKNEAERVKVLSEKHRRGAAARLLRAMKQKKKKCRADGYKDLKSKCKVKHTRSSKRGRSFELEKVKHLDGHRIAISDCQPQAATSSRKATWNQNATSRAVRSTRGWQKSAEIDCYQVPSYPFYVDSQQSFYQSQSNDQSRNELYEYFYYERGLIPSRIDFPPLRPCVDEFTSRPRHFVSENASNAHRNPRYSFEMKNLNSENVEKPLRQCHSRTKTYGWRK